MPLSREDAELRDMDEKTKKLKTLLKQAGNEIDHLHGSVRWRAGGILRLKLAKASGNEISRPTTAQNISSGSRNSKPPGGQSARKPEPLREKTGLSSAIGLLCSGAIMNQDYQLAQPRSRFVYSSARPLGWLEVEFRKTIELRVAEQIIDLDRTLLPKVKARGTRLTRKQSRR